MKTSVRFCILTHGTRKSLNRFFCLGLLGASEDKIAVSNCQSLLFIEAQPAQRLLFQHLYRSSFIWGCNCYILKHFVENKCVKTFRTFTVFFFCRENYRSISTSTVSSVTETDMIRCRKTKIITKLIFFKTNSKCRPNKKNDPLLKKLFFIDIYIDESSCSLSVVLSHWFILCCLKTVVLEET